MRMDVPQETLSATSLSKEAHKNIMVVLRNIKWVDVPKVLWVKNQMVE
jgi:hypothetical protein